MKLSFIFELLLIFVFIAFAASAVIDKRGYHNRKGELKKHVGRKSVDKRRQGSSGTNSNRYCSCNMKLCNCCREFNLPVVSLQGPGCASLQYLKGDRLAISMSFGERVLTNTTISSRKPQPVCMPLPGGISKFCGRIYNIGRKGDDFQACLGLELRSLSNIEASLRVSCFKFGPKGLRVEPSQPLPVVEEEEDDDDDEDDEDEFDFDGDDDDDEDEDDSENDVEAVEYGGFSVFDDDFIDQYFESDNTGSKKKPPAKKQPVQITKAPFKKTTKAPVTKPLRRKPVKTKTSPRPKPTRTSYITKAPKKTVRSTTATTPISIKTPFTTPTSSSTTLTSSTAADITEKASLIEESATAIPEQNITNNNFADFTQIKNEINTEASELSTVQNTIYTTIQSFTTTEATVSNDIKSSSTPKEEEDDDSIESSGSEENPIAEVVEDMLDESDEIIEKKNATLKSNKKKTNTTSVKEESDDVSDILDGVVDTITGEDSDEDKAENDDDEDEDDDDEFDDDDDENEDDEDRRRRKRKLELRKTGGRRSRDMWLDRLHW